MGAAPAVTAAPAADRTQAAASQPTSAPLPPHRWAHRFVHARCCKRAGFAIALEGHARLPLPAPLLFELLTHPDNAAILRSLDRCSYRRVLADDGAGRLTVAVEQETTCHFLFYTGKVCTPLLVEQDASQGTMTYRVPRKGEAPLFDGERGACGHLAALEGSWRVEADGPCGSVLRFAQAVSPRGLPPLLAGAVRSFALAQVRGTCEDLYAEALRINEGRPSLLLSGSLPGSRLPTETAAVSAGEPVGVPLPGKLALPDGGSNAGFDPPSVLDRLSVGSSASSGSEDGRSGSGGSSEDGSWSPFAAAGSTGGSSPFADACSGSSASANGRGGRPAASAVVASSAAGPASYPLPLQRLLSAASGCLEGCWASLANHSGPQPSLSCPTSPAGSSNPTAFCQPSPSSAAESCLLNSCPAWLIAAAAAALALLAALLRTLEAAVRAELHAAEACAARLAAAAQQPQQR